MRHGALLPIGLGEALGKFGSLRASAARVPGSPDWPHAPRFLGIDDRGREILSWIDGEVPWAAENQTAVRTEAGLVRVTRLLREFHDLTAGADLAGDQEVVCHNDLSPKNTVYRDHGDGLVPVAFLGWDDASPGLRIHNIAHACWQFVGLGRAGTR